MYPPLSVVFCGLGGLSSHVLAHYMFYSMFLPLDWDVNGEFNDQLGCCIVIITAMIIVVILITIMLISKSTGEIPVLQPYLGMSSQASHIVTEPHYSIVLPRRESEEGGPGDHSPFLFLQEANGESKLKCQTSEGESE